ncbi:hypothetical protein [Pseudomonas viridiflava]|uniref:hypothetical protein n=1 Tax=Pseudomonas viridiflava TaxID=33069 RepID=UPI000F03F9FC|nr:hypothetical protein [Pseudomonas viridiflava]
MADINEKIREEFEVWVKGQEWYFGDATESLSRCDEEPVEYLCGAVHGAWLGWQASRGALVIELPEHYQYDNPGEAFHAIKDCREAIESAGVKVTQ